MAGTPVTFIQLADTHLFGDKDRILLGVNTSDSFLAVLNLIQLRAEPVDFIIHSGDISQDGSESSYAYTASRLSEFGVPVYCIPGNHDDPKVMARVYPRDALSQHRHLVLKDWHLILLDTHKPGSVAGFLESSQLSYLEHCLQTYPQHHAMVMMHHQPVPIGSHWLDRVGLTNAERFWDTIARYPKVQHILFGHVHQEFEQVVKGVHLYATPSTCFQFKRHQDQFRLEELAPGYRIIKLFEDGKLETQVVRLANYVGEFDSNAKGY